MVDGSETLAKGAEPAVQSNYEQKCQKAFSTLALAIGTSQLYLVTSCTQPKDAWDTLRTLLKTGTEFSVFSEKHQKR